MYAFPVTVIRKHVNIHIDVFQIYLLQVEVHASVTAMRIRGRGTNLSTRFRAESWGVFCDMVAYLSPNSAWSGHDAWWLDSVTVTIITE